MINERGRPHHPQSFRDPNPDRPDFIEASLNPAAATRPAVPLQAFTTRSLVLRQLESDYRDVPRAKKTFAAPCRWTSVPAPSITDRYESSAPTQSGVPSRSSCPNAPAPAKPWVFLGDS